MCTLTSDDSTGITVTSVQTDTVTTRRAVNLDLASIRLEALGGILGSDSALDSETTGGNAVLGKTELAKSSTSSDLDLSSDNVDTSDLLSDGVLDLDTRVDLDEVVAVLLVNQELSSTGIAVTGGLGQSHSISENVVADLSGEILRRGDLNNLLVSSLNGAVTLVQVDNVAVVVTEKLDLDVLGLVKESLDKDGAVTEGSLGLGGGTLEGLLQALLLTDDSHTSATTTEGSLDDDGEAILVSEFLDLLVPLDSTFGTRDDGDVGSVGKLSGRDLVTESIDHVGRGADELGPGLVHGHDGSGGVDLDLQ